MLHADFTPRKLARASKVTEGTVNRGLRVVGRIKRDILRRWAKILGVESGTLLRALKETVPPAPRPAMLERVLRRGREGRELLRRRGKQRYKANLATPLSPERRKVVDEKRIAALREYHRSLTIEEQIRRSFACMHPHQLGRFGVCRVCGKLTFTEPSRLRGLAPRGTHTGEYHGPCWHQWTKQAPEWAEWLADAKRARRSGSTIPERPQCSYGRGRRPSSDDLAAYFEAAVLVGRLKYDISAPVRRAGAAEPVRYARSVAELAVLLGVSKRGLYLQVQRLLDYLPDPSICEKFFARKVRTLTTLRAQAMAA